MEKNYFEIATRKKFRFKSNKGIITVEDLWDLTVEKLDEIYINLNTLLKDTQQQSYLNKKSKDSELEEKIEIIKYIIDYKNDLKTKNEIKAKNEQKKKLILAELESREKDSIENMSEEDLKKLLESLND